MWRELHPETGIRTSAGKESGQTGTESIQFSEDKITKEHIVIPK